MPDIREAFFAFLTEHPEIDRDAALADFAAGLWVQHHLNWVHRSEHKEKWNPKFGTFDPAVHGDRYWES